MADRKRIAWTIMVVLQAIGIGLIAVFMFLIFSAERAADTMHLVFRGFTLLLVLSSISAIYFHNEISELVQERSRRGRSMHEDSATHAHPKQILTMGWALLVGSIIMFALSMIVGSEIWSR